MTEAAHWHCVLCGHTARSVVTAKIRDWEYGVEGAWDYVQCHSCQIIQLHPFPTLDELKKAYDIPYHGYEASGNKGLVYKLLYDIKEKLFLSHIKKFITGPRALDVGSGAGEFLLKLKAAGMTEVCGIDFNEKAVALAQQQGIDMFLGTFENYRRDSHFHLISMNNYLEHTCNPVSELAKAFELLEEGGWLVGEVPGFDSLDRQVAGRYWGGNHVPRHTFQFTRHTLSRLLQEAGFETVMIKDDLNTSHMALSLQNFRQRRRKDLKNNPTLRHGRMKGFSLWLLFFLPVNVLAVFLGKSGVRKFYARKPG